jgi:hypothetical protein
MAATSRWRCARWARHLGVQPGLAHTREDDEDWDKPQTVWFDDGREPAYLRRAHKQSGEMAASIEAEFRRCCCRQQQASFVRLGPPHGYLAFMSGNAGFDLDRAA